MLQSHATVSTPQHQLKNQEETDPCHQNDGQHPLTCSSYRLHCQIKTLKLMQPEAPSENTRSHREMSRHLSQDTTTSNISLQQVSHFKTVNPISSMDTILITDTTIDGHTSFHTTLQVITCHGSKPLHAKVEPGASCNSIPLSCFHKVFPKYFTNSGALKRTAVKPTWMTWSAHDGMFQNF